MKKFFGRSLGVIAAVALAWFGASQAGLLGAAGTAYAIGDLTINWGVPSGDPIFVVPDMVPGQTETRTVEVSNGAPGDRPMGVQGVEDTLDSALAEVLLLTIAVNGTSVYGEGSATGEKTLADFFSDSAGLTGIALVTVPSGQTREIMFTVQFAESAGNEFQQTSVQFDLTLGIAVDLPAECAAIEFSGDPIFGTRRGERLRGTNGNDLIIGFEGGDSIDGRNGDDCILGGPGGDALNGGNGNDVLFGEAGGDSLRGGNGADLLFGGDGSDGLYGGNGADTAFGGAGSDGLFGNNGPDTLLGEAGSDFAAGGLGSDTCDAEATISCEE